MKQELAPRGVGISGLQAGEDVKASAIPYVDHTLKRAMIRQCLAAIKEMLK